MNRKLQKWRHQFVNNIFRFQQCAKPNIVLFASRRGGSTLLAEAININHGIWFVNEPFAYIEGHSSNTAQQRALLNPKLHSIYLSVDEGEEAGIRSYVDGLLHAKLRQNGYLRRPVNFLTANRSLPSTAPRSRPPQRCQLPARSGPQ